MKIIDLTQKLSPEISSWDGSVGFELSLNIDYKDCTSPDLFRTQKIKCNAGMGTHMDAPAHAIPGGRTIDQLSVEELVIECVVIDVSMEADADYLIMPASIEKFEKAQGKIKPNNFVIFYTGWDKHWSDRVKYNNEHHFPSIHETTAQLLIERNITGIGIDTLSADTGLQGFPVHRIILGADKYLVENITNAKYLPSVGSKIFILPINIKDGTEAPIRLIALI